jgi:hypothetical protein
VNNKQIVVTGLKDKVIFIVIFNTCITRMITMKEVTKRLPFQKTVEFLNYILGELQRTKQSVKMTPVAAVKASHIPRSWILLYSSPHVGN